MRKVDYIIVGQGIAGSVLALKLIAAGKRLVVIDAQEEITSSKIAYGVCNPIVFKRFVKTYLADESFTIARNFYEQQEKVLSQQFFSQVKLYKLFNSAEQKSDWIQKSTTKELCDYLSNQVEDLPNVLNPFGAAEVKGTFMINTVNFLRSVTNFLNQKKSFIKDQFENTYVNLTENGIEYKDIKASKIIFCEGFKGAKNPWFNWLPFNLCKGEKLDVQFDDLHTEHIISNNVSLIPDGEKYIIGSTYSWDNFEEIPSEGGKNELLEKFEKISSIKPHIIDHKAAIRPTTIDRRPFLGLHPDHKQLAIFNGMGTKSVMFTPFLADKFISFLDRQIDIVPEISITRYSHLFLTQKRLNEF